MQWLAQTQLETGTTDYTVQFKDVHYRTVLQNR